MNLRILVDLDGIVADLLPAWLALYNRDWLDDLRPEQITTWDLHPHVKPACGRRMDEFLRYPGLFLGLPEIPAAVDALRRLQGDGHDILLVSAPPCPGAAAEKLRWVRQHLPFLGVERLVLTSRKEVVAGDVLIDDSPANLFAYRAAYPLAKLATIGYPYNSEVPAGTLRAEGWRDTQAAWDAIVREVRR